MAAAHRAALKLLDGSLNSSLPAVEMAKLLNAAERMMRIYQGALLTLQKIRNDKRRGILKMAILRATSRKRLAVALRLQV